MAKRKNRREGAPPAPDGASADLPEDDGAEGGFVWLFLGILLLVPIVPWPFLHWNSSTFEIFAPAEKLVFQVLTVAAGLFSLRAVRHHFQHLMLQPLDLSLFLLYLYFALSALWSATPEISRDAGLTGLGFLLFYVLAKHAVARKDMVGPAIACILIAVAVNNVYAVGQLLGFQWMKFGSGEEPIGLLGNRNHLAYFLALTLPIGLFRGWTDNRLYRKLGLWNFYLSLIVLWFTGCRGGLLAGLVTLGCFHVFKRQQDVVANRARKPMPPYVRWAIGGAVALSCFMLVGVGVYAPQKLQSVKSRLFTWKLTMKGVWKAPMFGHGAGTFGNVYQQVQANYFRTLANNPKKLESGRWRLARHNRQAHNDYLQVLFELGLIGLGLFLLAIAMALREFLGSYLAHGNLERIRWYPLWGSIFIGGLVEALSGFPFQVVPTAMLITFALAVISALSLEERESVIAATPDATDEPLPQLPAPFFYVLASALSLYLGLTTLWQWQAEVAFFQARNERAAGRLDTAAKALEASLELQPNDGRVWNDLGQTQFLQARYDEARRSFQKAAELYLDASVLINLGCVEAAGGQMDKARREFDEALAMDPFSSETHYRVGHLQATLRQFTAAEASLKRAMTVNIRDHKVPWTYARVLADMGKGAEAEKQFRDNIDLLKAQLREGTIDEVVVRHYVAQNYLSLAGLYEREKKPEQARQCYEEARVYDRSVRPVESKT